jgi:hypothetical protein
MPGAATKRRAFGFVERFERLLCDERGDRRGALVEI